MDEHLKHSGAERKHGPSRSEWVVFEDGDRKWVGISKIILES